ncbi:MAG: potassium transporter Kup [Betaproteobacteria bacterium RIFCSPLOWO2_12_FULL_63_13]|nr:MAG: potassium transporter Kup [Betaproteobacteria bacterium RIFCSPLOWO2_02_FULL_63_19]OGA45123.1 MAG: potassium transporter Kup [Betaproteobacteria bacterium RIFCSPLOWO2_12_FULL_63_13]
MQTEKSRMSAISLAALGIVYGDIGTSPLYAIKEIFGGPHSLPLDPDHILAALSLVFWALIVVVSLKYVGFILRADNRGQGGIMALMALALRGIAESRGRRSTLIVLGLIGTSLFCGEGVITPAISVLSAVEGLEVATPAFKPYVLPITIMVLFGLFLVQRRGTATVGALFGPVMLLWFSSLAALGIFGIAKDPRILMALNPVHALAFIAREPVLALLALGGVVLVVTGVEALYADMGHFGRRPITLAWFGLVLPALLLNYFGQGALLMHNPRAAQNPFYLLAPDWALYPLVALATAATIIASQAVISGAFSIAHQAIQLGYLPRMDVQHTSEREFGQVYVPSINWTLLIAVIALVLSFGSSTNLAAAYGLAVTGTMVVTTILAYTVARQIWRWSPARAGLLFLAFLIVDITFFCANIVKIPQGGWFPVMFGVGIYLLLITWKQGRIIMHARLKESALSLNSFLEHLPGSSEAPRVPGTAMFLTSNPDGVPSAMLHNLKHNKVLHQRVVIVTVEVLDIPHVAVAQRVMVEKLPHEFWRVRVYYGFMEEPDLPEALEWCAEQGLQIDMMDTSFFLGRETLIPKLGARMPLWREKLFITMFRNASSATSYFRLPPNRVVELGTQLEL